MSAWRHYTEQLERADIIASPGAGKGLPMLLPWGLGVLRRLTDAFASELACLYPLRLRAPRLLRDADGYDAEVAEFGGFDGVYRLRHGSSASIVRPDAAVDNLIEARRAAEAGWDGAVLSVYQGFRAVKGLTPPLFRDRCIWPFIQMNRLVRAAHVERASLDVVHALLRLFESLGIWVRVVCQGPWKSYARRLYEAVAILPDGRPTVVAMFYVVGDSYRRAAGISSEWEAFDIGISQKPLAVLALGSGASSGVSLPSRLSPVHAVVASEAGSWPVQVPRDDNVLAVSLDIPEWPRAWQRRGVPILVESRGERVRCRLTLGRWQAWPREHSFDDLVAASDRLLLQRSAAIAEAHAERWFRVLCSACRPAQGICADVVPAETGACASCGRTGRLSLVLDAAQFY